MLKLLIGVCVVLVAWVGAGLVMVATAGSPPPRGAFVDIGGRKLRLVCEGPKGEAPLIWFEHGAFGTATDFAALQKKLTDKGLRSCAYDRAGLGFSEPGPKPRDVNAALGDLEKLMAAAGEPGPFVLVGHSMAGLHLRRFATVHPERVAGIVLVDATTPESADSPRMNQFLGIFEGISRFAAVAGTIGLTKPFYYMGERIGLPPEAVNEKRRIFVNGRHARNAAAEVLNWRESVPQAASGGPLPTDMPVAVIVAGAGDPDGPRAAPAKLSKAGYFEAVPAATHTSILGMTYGDAVIRGVEHVLRSKPRP